MFELRSFALEDFFRLYEHRPGLLNLASSDASPWTLQDMIARCPHLQQDLLQLDLQYPDIDGALLPSLAKFCKPASGIGVLVVSGAAEAIFLVLAEHVSRNHSRRRIALPLPSYGAFEGISHFFDFDIQLYKYQPNVEWSVDAEELRTLSAQSDLVVVNNPHNPTGQLIDQTLLEEISEIVHRRGGTLLVDEVFRLPENCDSATRLGAHVTVIGSLSKVYGMPGLRLGWIVTDSARLNRFRTLQQYATLSPNAFTAKLGATVVDSIDNFSRGDLLKRNRQIIRQWADDHAEGLRIIDPSAGTTAVLEIKTSKEEGELFSAFLDAGVLLVPGSRCFGITGPKPWFRLGYGAREDVLCRGLQAVAQAVQ